MAKIRIDRWKRAAVCCLAGILLMTQIPGSVVSAAGEAFGTKPADSEEIMTISDVEDFLKFADLCRNDLYSYGKVFSLENDIDLTGADFECVAYFTGTFEGNGHTVSNLRIARKGSDYGFFRYLGKTAQVRDLTVTGEVNLEGSGENAGGIAGVNFGTIDGCAFHGSISGKTGAGGIVGYNKADGMILSCSVTGAVEATDRTGGICGENKGIIQQCVNRSTVNGEDLKTTLDLNGVDLGTLNLTQNVVTRNDSGGIAGISSGTISGCDNRGNIGFAHVGYNVGGIVGRQSGTLIDCTNSGKVWGRKDVGGIVGQAEPYRESEYLSDHLEKVKDDFSKINNLVVQISNALSATSSDTKNYTQALQQQYEDTVSSLNDEVNALKNTISQNNANTREYINSISDAISSLGNLGNDTVKKMTDSIRSNAQNAVDKIKDKIEDLKEKEETKTEEESSSSAQESSDSEEESKTESSGSEEGSSESSSSEESGEDEDDSHQRESGKDEDSSDESDRAESGSAQESDSDEKNQKDAGSQEEEQSREPADAAAENLTYEEGEALGRYFTQEHVGREKKEEEDSFTLPIELPTELPTDLPVEIPTKHPELPDKDEIESKVDELLEDPVKFEHDEEIDKNLDRMHRELTSISENIRNLEDTVTGTGESLTNTAGNISGELTDRSKASGDTVDSMTDSIDNGIQSMTGNLNNIMNTSRRITDFVSEDIDILMGNGNALLDISSEKVTDKTLGVVSGCVNRGSVWADINVGGITGIMNVEYDLDPELDLDLAKVTDVTVRSTTNDVLIHCKNYGAVNAKKNNCGGIAGYEELGLIHDCENYGEVVSESGSRLGGVAGLSESRINQSYAFCNLEGRASVGGIAGEGYDISGCRAMCNLTCADGEKAGSIAGWVEEQAALSDNFFVYDGWDGVDNISYIGKAESCTYEEMMQTAGIPDGFSTVTVTFEKEGTGAGTVRIPYGGTVTEKEIPRIPASEDCYLKWDREFPIEDVKSNLIITAEDVRFTKSLAYPACYEEGKADFLVEGDFYEDSRIDAQEAEIPPKEGMTAAYAYTWSLEHVPEEKGDYLLHFRIPEKAAETQVWFVKDGSWEKAVLQQDGSYVTAALPYGAQFAVYGKEKGTASLYLACGAGAAAVLLLFLVKRRNRKRGSA